MEEVKHRNGIRYQNDIKAKAIELRQLGYTHRQIVRELGISLGSAGLWTKNITLTEEQKRSIEERRHQHRFSKEEKKLVLKRLQKFQFKKKYDDAYLLKKIQHFYAENGRIPLKCEFSDPKIFRARFKTWNNAIKLAGFEPNPVLFAKKFIAKDGHKCDSFSEKVTDDWLFENKIAHARNYRYAKTKMTADFLLPSRVVLEFFGLAGVQKEYDKNLLKKRKLSEKLGLKLIEIYPHDLFPVSSLPNLLGLL